MLAFSSSSANGGHVSQRWATAGDDTRGNPPGEWPPRRRPCSYVAWYPAAVLFGSGVFPEHDPGTGDSYLHLFPWQKAIEAISASGC